MRRRAWMVQGRGMVPQAPRRAQQQVPDLVSQQSSWMPLEQPVPVLARFGLSYRASSGSIVKLTFDTMSTRKSFSLISHASTLFVSGRILPASCSLS